MDSPPVVLDVGTELGEAYIAAMKLAGGYAYAGRDVGVRRCSRSWAREATPVHNHHNFAWRENHNGKDLLGRPQGLHAGVPGPGGFVGGTMGDESVILEGVEDRGRASRSTRPSTAPAA